MNDAMIHRGPDEEGLYVSQDLRAGISIRRLSIVDLEHGSQPMFSEDRSVAVVCNGEIYNHRALRKELQQKGYRFRGHSDSEVLAHLYLEEGIDFLNRLNGMFALAVLDMRTHSLLLARDPVGMKHLYWGETADGFVFASEVRALIASGLVTPGPDWEALSRYFTFGWIQSPHTAFDGLQKLRPGSLVRVDETGVTEDRFWIPRYEKPETNRSLESYSGELKQLLESAVGTHLDADVPAGLFLSGGWDSSLVSLYASRLSAEPLNSYSLVFPDDPGSDESRYSRQVARQAGTRSHDIELSHEDILNALNATSVALEEPVVTSPTALGYLLSESAGRDVKMVLGGEGADEIFAGYSRFAISPLHRLRQLVPHPLWPASLPIPLDVKWSRAFRFLAAPDDELAHLQLMSAYMPQQTLPLFRKGRTKPSHYCRDALGVEQGTRESFRNSLDLKLSVELTGRLADGILFAHDKTAMSHSLEIRMPFLDRTVVQFAHRLPSEYKVRGSAMKRVLAGLAEELPPGVAARTKQGLHMPPAIFGGAATRKFYADTILETSLSTGLFEHHRLESWVTKGAAGPIPSSFQLWPLCHFCLWWNNFIQAGASDFRAQGVMS
jgi:asparagine synthase (glutamine-hydrolysing)